MVSFEAQNQGMQTYVAVHEHDAGINVVDHLAKALIIHQLACTRGVQPTCGIVKVLIVMEVRSDVMRQLLEAALLIEQVLTLRLERGCLGFHSLERIGQGGEQLQAGVGVIYQPVKMALCESQLIAIQASAG